MVNFTLHTNSTSTGNGDRLPTTGPTTAQEEGKGRRANAAPARTMLCTSLSMVKPRRRGW